MAALGPRCRNAGRGPSLSKVSARFVFLCDILCLNHLCDRVMPWVGSVYEECSSLGFGGNYHPHLQDLKARRNQQKQMASWTWVYCLACCSTLKMEAMCFLQSTRYERFWFSSYVENRVTFCWRSEYVIVGWWRHHEWCLRQTVRSHVEQLSISLDWFYYLLYVSLEMFKC